MKMTKWLAVIVLMQGMILAGQWTGGRNVLPAAQAAGDLPDPGSRQMQMIEEMKSTNSKLDRLIGLLEGGNLQVHVVASDDAKGGHAK